MREGSGVGEKLIGNGSRSGYSESDKGGDTATLSKKSLAFGFFFKFFIKEFSCLQVAHPKNV
jgi:hypothetical protein